MDRNAFADLVTSALTTSVLLMDAVAGMGWNSDSDALLVRLQPLNTDEWESTCHAAMDAIRDLSHRVRISCRYQMLRVADAVNIVFAIKPQTTS